MHLDVLVPTRVAVDCDVEKVSAEGAEGSFTLLPEHIDIVCSLRPGLLSFHDVDGNETFLAIDGGVLVKQQQTVRVSTPRAVRGELGELRQAVEQEFRRLSQRQEQARTATEKMRADFIRRFIELERPS